MKQILLINGHPDKESFNYALSKAYLEGAGISNGKIEQINIADLTFDPNLKYGYRKRMTLEPDLEDAIKKIKEADHLVWIFPMWWYGYPAIMKGFIDRTFLPDITFRMVKGKVFQEKLLKGKTARIIVTSDTPKWYDWLVMGSPALNQFKKGTLEFCGIGPVKVSYIAPVRDSGHKFRQEWLAKVKKLGKRLG